mmetsp:Transcript_106334/g.216862  ORF Transcript_106334/g.216862 Transcript_106334/m.216862 type:complete len:150 (-) Transcript_106334:1104-1553(-)
MANRKENRNEQRGLVNGRSNQTTTAQGNRLQDSVHATWLLEPFRGRMFIARYANTRIFFCERRTLQRKETRFIRESKEKLIFHLQFVFKANTIRPSEVCNRHDDILICDVLRKKCSGIDANRFLFNYLYRRRVEVRDHCYKVHRETFLY